MFNVHYIWLADQPRGPNWSGVRWNFIKFEIKKGVEKKKKTSTWRGRVFRVELKGTENKFCLKELWSSSAFVMLKITFSKHRLIKISTTHVYIKIEVKKWDNSHGYSHKWSLYRVTRWKLLFHGEGMTLLIVEEVNFIMGNFLVG